MCQGCDWGIVWSVFNFICGLGIVIGHISLDPCAWLRILIGVAICWVAITHGCCDKFALAWFPFWEKSFIFMGCTFIFFSCGAWWRGCGNNGGKNDDNCPFVESFAGWILFFTFAVGVLYLIFGAIEYFGAASIPHPSPLAGCCGGGGGGSGGGSGGKQGGGDAENQNSGSGKKKGTGGGGGTKSGARKGTGTKSGAKKKKPKQPQNAMTNAYG
mmetsp:Transcript_8197/g.12689  ORF Transcript_8197/g.12689 Transcript_8197/m.12689 type:complete len:214 (-) Transcript_8197:145-786(-)